MARPDTTPVTEAAGTGIDYLGLIEARHAAELATRIDYSQLRATGGSEGQCPGQLTLPDTNDDEASNR